MPYVGHCEVLGYRCRRSEHCESGWRGFQSPGAAVMDVGHLEWDGMLLKNVTGVTLVDLSETLFFPAEDRMQVRRGGNAVTDIWGSKTEDVSLKRP